jgi:hypothetical protein
LPRCWPGDVDSVQVAPFGQGEIGADLFRRAYPGRCKHWLKTKN